MPFEITILIHEDKDLSIRETSVHATVIGGFLRYIAGNSAILDLPDFFSSSTTSTDSTMIDPMTRFTKFTSNIVDLRVDNQPVNIPLHSALSVESLKVCCK